MQNPIQVGVEPKIVKSVLTTQLSLFPTHYLRRCAAPSRPIVSGFPINIHERSRRGYFPGGQITHEAD